MLVEMLKAVEGLPVPAGVELVPDAASLRQAEQVDPGVCPRNGREAVYAIPRGSSSRLWRNVRACCQGESLDYLPLQLEYWK